MQIELDVLSTLLYPTRVYSIPKNEIGANIPIKFNISIHHTSSNYFYINPVKAFIPELLTLDGKIIQGCLGADKAITNNQSKPSNWWHIRPNCRTTFAVTAKLFWEENSLQLKIPAVSDYVLGSVSPAYFWYFDGLGAET